MSEKMVEINGVMVAAIKEKFIRAMIEAISKEKHAKQLILFGSVLEERCREDSDIDFVVVGDLPQVAGYRIVERVEDAVLKINVYQSMDALYYKSGNKLLAEVRETGYLRNRVIAWER